VAEPVRCRACGTGVEVAPGRCPKCGLLVGAPRPAPRVAPVAHVPASETGGGWVIVAVLGVVVMVAAGGAAFYYVRTREHARRAEAAEVEARWLAEAQRADAERVRRGRPEGGGGDNQPEVGRDDPLVVPPGLFPFVPGPPLDPAEAGARIDALAGRLLGVWTGVGADGGTRVVEYRDDGTFRDEVTGGPAPRRWAGTWTVERLVGTRGLRLTRTGGGPDAVRVAFERGELVHDDTPGRGTVLRR
jgi:hypothetical protein